MSIKRIFAVFLLIILTLITGCSKQVLLDENKSSKLNYKFKVNNINNLDKILSNKVYSYSSKLDNKYIAVITYQSKEAKMYQYLVNNNESISITIPKNSQFIISLPSNNTVAYTWNANDTIDKSEIIKFVKHTEFSIPYSVKKSTGINYSRQNFYFTPKKDGAETLVMSYEHASEPNDKSFKITLKIKVK